MYRAYDLSSTDSTVCDIERVPKKVEVFRGDMLHRKLVSRQPVNKRCDRAPGLARA